MTEMTTARRSAQRRRFALFALFALPGFAISSWVARTPDIRDAIGASTEEMGFVLFGVSCGAMLGVAVSAALIARYGARAVTAAGMTGIVLSMPVVGMGAGAGLAGVVALGLFLFGAGMGLCDIAVNVEAASLEREAAIVVLPPMHGCFSVGTAIGALLGVWGNVADFPVRDHLLLVGLVSAPVLAMQIRRLPARTGVRTEIASLGKTAPVMRAPWKDGRLVLIGLIVLAMALAEGAATDWLPLVMVDGHGASPAAGAFVYAAFACSMAVGRFGGGPLLARYGAASVLRFSATAAVVGIGCIALLDDNTVAGASVLLWGLGLSLGFPVAISVAGDSGQDSAARVSFVTTMGYLAFLAGPPLLGVIGQDYGLRMALLVPLALVVLAIVLAPALTIDASTSEGPASA